MFLLLAVLASAIYFPGLSGPYVLDDDENISRNETVAVKELSATNVWYAMQGNHSGPLKRPLANLSFALNHYFAGGFANTLPFKLTNLFIHVANGVLVLLLALQILQVTDMSRGMTRGEIASAATLASILWTTHPIQLTNVLYVVQRMNSLSALFVLLGLLVFIEGRRRYVQATTTGLATMTAGILFGTLFGMASKENAALLPLFALVVEYSLFRREELNANSRLLLRLFYVVVLAVPCAIFLGYLYVSPEFLADGYKVRHFSMLERLLTETRVLWHYLFLTILPSTHSLGLFHDDIAISEGLLSPPTTLLATCGLIALLLIAFVKDNPAMRFAILWFFAGHVLESSVFGLEVAYEHRNYLPIFGITFLVSYFLVNASRRWHAGLRIMVPAAVIFALSFSTWTRAHTWKDIYSLAETSAANHPDSPRANEFAALVNATAAGNYVGAIRYTLQALRVAPSEAGFHIDLRRYMALLASQIEKDMGLAKMGNTKEARIRIDGLPPVITATYRGTKVHLYYPLSTDDSIAELLRSKPLTVHTLRSLVALDQCVTQNPDACRRLAEPALNWYVVAADNPFAAKTHRALILDTTAEMYSNRSDSMTALIYINRATETFPDVLYFRLKKAEHLIKLGRLDEARQLLSEIEAAKAEKDARLLANRKLVESVRQMYAGAIKAAAQSR